MSVLGRLPLSHRLDYASDPPEKMPNAMPDTTMSMKQPLTYEFLLNVFKRVRRGVSGQPC